MMFVFSYMMEKTIEVFMGAFLVVEKSIDQCLDNIVKVLKRCEDYTLVINLEKYHFMVRECIVLGHRISNTYIQVDRAKVEVI